MSFLIIGKAWTPLLLRLVDAEHVDVELTVMPWEPEGPGEGRMIGDCAERVPFP